MRHFRSRSLVCLALLATTLLSGCLGMPRPLAKHHGSTCPELRQHSRSTVSKSQLARLHRENDQHHATAVANSPRVLDASER